MSKKLKTLDELAGNPPGTFKKMIDQEEAELNRLEAERIERWREAARKRDRESREQKG